MPAGDKVIDIRSGEAKLPQDISSDEQTLLKVSLDASRCFVSDLDIYDEIKALLAAGHKEPAKQLAALYWQSVQPLKTYDHSTRRPEIIVTYDIKPEDILGTV